jgi:MFS family permease
MTERANRAVLFSASLGALFDGFDASLFGIVLFPAVSDLIQSESHAVVGPVGAIILAIFMIGWALGAIGFGFLSDRIGRVRTMMFTILLYAVSAGLCSISQSWQELALYRFLVGLGIGGEQGAGAILLSEWFQGKNRHWSIGVMTASIGVGYLLTSVVNFYLGHAGWRYVCLAGIIPAFLAFYVRSKLSDPETSVAALHHDTPSQFASLRRILSADLRKTLIILTLASAAIVNWWAVLSWVPAWINQLTGGLAVVERSVVMFAMYSGAIISSIVGVPILLHLRRRKAFALTFVGSLVIDATMFLCSHNYGPSLIIFASLAGAFAALPFLWLFISVPEMYPISVRGTAFGVSIQTGRMLAAIFAIVGGQLIAACHGSYAIAGSCVALINIVGFLGSFFVPEEENYLLAEEALRQTTAETSSIALPEYS